jgi:predicted kinase
MSEDRMELRGTPTLIVISGPPGAGKTTLAHRIAEAISCPAISRDEIKEGMVHATPTFEPSQGDDLTRRTFPLFFEVLRLLLESGVTVVAEAAFDDERWRPNLIPLARLASLRIVQCHTDFETRMSRRTGRIRKAHADAQTLADPQQLVDRFDRLNIDAPSVDVNTTVGYQPCIEDIVAFINAEPTDKRSG